MSRVKFGGTIAFIDCGGPEYDISVGGRIFHFEMHPYIGPVVLNGHGDPASVQPITFLKAASLWAQQGQRVENGLCVWDHEPEEILKHMGGRNWLFVGYYPAKKGQ